MIKMRPKKSGFFLLALLGAMGFTLPVWAQDMIDVSDANRIALGIQTERLQSATKIELTKATGRAVAPIGQSQFISSPFDGVLMKPLVVAGIFYLTATDNGIITHVHAASGTALSIADPVTTLFSGETYWASIPVPSANINSIEIGTAISFQNTDLTGSVIAIDPEVDGVSQTVDVTIELPAGLSWRLGGLVTATFLAPPPSGAVAVPSRAIVRMSGQTYVFPGRSGSAYCSAAGARAFGCPKPNGYAGDGEIRHCRCDD